MRIISQDGMFDIPYERVILQRFKGKIYCLNKNLMGMERGAKDDIVIASYSTDAKAEKAMEMLRSHYKKFCNKEAAGGYVRPCFQFPSDKELED